jgi:hypothetical protein
MKIIKHPKYSEKGIRFSCNGDFCGVSERKEGKDSIGIYFSGGEWKLVLQMLVETIDLQDIEWSSDGSWLLVWDSQLEFKLLVYSVV